MKEKPTVSEIRCELNLSVRKFALLFGVQNNTVWRWESNKAEPIPLLYSLMICALKMRRKGHLSDRLIKEILNKRRQRYDTESICESLFLLFGKEAI